MQYGKTDELKFLRDLMDKVLNENMMMLSSGTMLFHECGILVTDDIEQEFINPDKPETIVETEYAQELSWLLRQIKTGLDDTASYFRKDEFYGMLADAALESLQRTDDRSAMLLAVLLQASMLVGNTLRTRNDRMRDEVLSCAASLSDLAEKL